jgi:hypothetical protein
VGCLDSDALPTCYSGFQDTNGWCSGSGLLGENGVDETAIFFMREVGKTVAECGIQTNEGIRELASFNPARQARCEEKLERREESVHRPVYDLYRNSFRTR